MSYKFDSLITILNKLDKGEHATVQSLMDDLEMSERTVHRYLKTLQVAGSGMEGALDSICGLLGRSIFDTLAMARILDRLGRY